MKETIIWIVLPDGIHGLPRGRQQLRFSIKVSPRLTADGRGTGLGRFTRWPDNIPAAFPVRFAHLPDNAAPLMARLDPKVPLDSTLWAKLFPPNTNIHSYDFRESDFRNRPILSYPVSNVLGHVKTAVQAAGLESPNRLPAVAAIIGKRSGSIVGDGDTLEWKTPGYLGDPDVLDTFKHPRWRNGIREELLARGFVKAGKPPHICRDLAQAREFFRFSPQNDKYADKPDKPVPDFHELLSMLDDYPYLLRRLGLVLDLVCDLPAGFASIPQPKRRLKLAWAGSTDVCPWTAFEADFRAANKTPDTYTDGLLDLSKAHFSVTDVDVDGASFKYTNLIDTARRLQGQIHTSGNAMQTPETMGLPALRTGGISVIQTGRAETFAQTIKNNGQLNDTMTSPDLCLYAEDLTKGVAVDVRVLRAGPQDPRSGPWRSLCQRKEFYDVRPIGSDTFDKDLTGQIGEGTLMAAITSPSEIKGQAGGELRLHESLFAWDGWSLAVRRPGKKIEDGGHQPTDSNPEVPLESRLSTRFEVVGGSLPKLRFGRKYALRARAVDLAGNGKKCGNGETSLTGAFPEITFHRYEPVAAPVMVAVISPTRPLNGYVAGESLEYLVIRSPNDKPEDNLKPTADTTARWFVPPRVAQEMAERHGMFEATPPDGQSWYELIEKRSGDKGQLPEWATPTPLQLQEPPYLPVLPDVPYLPDPLAQFTAIRGLPGSTDPLLIKSSAAVWPHAAPFRLALREGKLAYAWDETTRVLTVSLPKAAVLRLRVSSALESPQALALLGIWAWLAEAAAPEQATKPQELTKLQELALSGGHWLLTPWRELVLSHAVQRPLEPPRFQQFAPAPRMPGETRVVFSGQVQVHAASTGKVEVGASWFDRVDDMPKGTGNDWSGQQAANPFYLTNTAPLQTLLSCAGKTQEFGDSRHRRVTYHVTATTLFADCFVDEASDGVVKGLEPVTLDIPSSARPAAPDVDYIIPTFGWELAHEPDWHGKPPPGTASQPPEANTVVKSQRRGGSVRVYLRRPWFSSGDGELLGVVIAPVPALRLNHEHMTESLTLPNGLAALVTQWGYDPIWIAHGTYAVPSLHHFPAAKVRESGLALEELANSTARVAVAAHPVSFDQERQLWYCDIPMDTGPTYFPFVRLALARYQPCSVQGVELSRVTLADFIQLAPDRSATVVSDARDPCVVHLSVSGAFPIAPTRWRISEKLAFASIVMVRTEMLDPTDTQGQTWLPTGTPTQLIPSHVTLAASVWMGEIRLPSARGSQRFRLLIQEEEVLEEDLRTAEVGALLAINRPPIRTVYTDVIEI